MSHANGRGDAPEVVITGIGLLTCLGADRETSWRRLREGACGLVRLPGVETGDGPPHCGGPVPDAPRRSSWLFHRAADEALRDAGLHARPFDRDRAGVVAGLSKGDLGRLAGLRENAGGEGSELASWLDAWPHAGAARVAADWDLRGPCLAPVAACATGLIAALRGADLIRRGVCDLVLVGAGDASLDPLVLGAFRRMGVLARGDDPTRALRPWDRDRSGFLVGEGAAALVLERSDHARQHEARAYAEFAGGAFGGDAFHETALNPDPRGLAALIGRALAAAGTAAEEVDHVNVHGTATRSNDPLECQALSLAPGEAAGRASCSANKAQVGHLLGAAVAAELAFTALAVRDGFVPPTLNLDHPDPLCNLDGTPHVGTPRPSCAALKLSIGFGGHLAAAVLRRVEPDR